MQRLFLCLVAVAIGTAAVLYGTRPVLGTNPPSESMVKVLVGTGHGSGVHIGNGLARGAALVVDDVKSVRLKLTNSQIVSGEVLWASKGRDVALIRADYPHRMAATNLECRPLMVGEDISIYGNPLSVDAMRTFGRVGGQPRSMGEWKRVVPVDASAAPGNSGGPVFDADGDLVGLLVGAALMPIGFGASLVGISYFVPAETICELLARD